jgi:hypothetical protein
MGEARAAVNADLGLTSAKGRAPNAVVERRASEAPSLPRAVHIGSHRATRRLSALPDRRALCILGPMSGAPLSDRMIQAVKRRVRDNRLYDALWAVAQDHQVGRWIRAGRPVPPPNLVKQNVLRCYARRFSLRTLVETGTYYGDTLYALRHDFDRLYSIELDEQLHRWARARFVRTPQVELLHGDSGVVLPQLLPRLRERCLFWLDGHFCGGLTACADQVSPILRELGYLLAADAPDHVVLVDDARLFRPEEGYPLLEQLFALVAAARPGWTCEVSEDIIRIHAPAR